MLLYVKKNGKVVLKILSANKIQWLKSCETLTLCIALNLLLDKR